MIIKRVAPLSAAKIAGTLYLILGFIIGAFVSLFALIGAAFSSSIEPHNPTAFAGSAQIGVGSIVIFPILYGAIGFIGSLIAAALYNVLARAVGGIRIEVESEPSPILAGPVQSGERAV